MELKLKILPPAMPSEFYTQSNPSSKQEGINFGANSHPITDFTQEQAEEFAEMMKEAFLEHYTNLKQKLTEGNLNSWRR